MSDPGDGVKKTYDRQVSRSNEYVDKLTKLIPSDIVAAYLAIRNAAMSSDNQQIAFNVMVISAAILTVLAYFYLGRVGVRSPPQRIVTCLSFVVWALSLGGILETYTWYSTLYSTVAIIIWTLMAPVLVDMFDSNGPSGEG
jgi:hypothetical protein